MTNAPSIPSESPSSDLMLILKIPMILSITWGMHTTLTPPQPPPSSRERVGFRKDRLDIAIASFLKVCFWIVGLAEVLTILASLTPSGEIAKTILHALTNSAAPPSLEINLMFLLGWLLNLLGSTLRRRCYTLLDKLFTFELSIRDDHKLITSGPYSIVRHPSYTGAALAGCGAVLAHLNHGSWAVRCSGLIPDSVGVWVMLWLFGVLVGLWVIGPRLMREDEMLRENFGGEWERWATVVLYRLVPYVY